MWGLADGRVFTISPRFSVATIGLDSAHISDVERIPGNRGTVGTRHRILAELLGLVLAKVAISRCHGPY